MRKCKIVVIIPMYNAALTIRDTIKSVLYQKNVDFRIVVVDHGSSDGCHELISDMSDKVKIIRLERKKNEIKSASRPLNEGIRYALHEMRQYVDRNSFYIRLDSDDIFISDTVLYQLESKYKSGIKFINGRICMYDSVKKSVADYGVSSEYRSREKLLKGSSYAIAHHASLISFSILERIIKKDGFCYDEGLGYGEDFDLSFRVIENCKDQEIVFCDNYIILKRLDGNTITNMMKQKSILADHLKIFSKHKGISIIFKLEVCSWFFAQIFGKWGQKINAMKKPPVYKYVDINVLSYKFVEKALMWINK